MVVFKRQAAVPFALDSPQTKYLTFKQYVDELLKTNSDRTTNLKYPLIYAGLYRSEVLQESPETMRDVSTLNFFKDYALAINERPYKVVCEAAKAYLRLKIQEDFINYINEVGLAVHASRKSDKANADMLQQLQSFGSTSVADLELLRDCQELIVITRQEYRDKMSDLIEDATTMAVKVPPEEDYIITE